MATCPKSGSISLDELRARSFWASSQLSGEDCLPALTTAAGCRGLFSPRQGSGRPGRGARQDKDRGSAFSPPPAPHSRTLCSLEAEAKLGSLPLFSFRGLCGAV